MAENTEVATRKLQQVGGGTFTVSVPKEWARERGLSAGDCVAIHRDGDGSLVVRGDGEAAASAGDATVPADDDPPETLARTVRAAHAAGLDRVTFTGTEMLAADARRRIDRAARAQTGTRVADEGEDTVTVATMLDDGEVSVRQTVVQLQHVALSAFRTATAAALDGEATGDRVADRRREARRLAALVRRQFSRSLSRAATAGALDVDRQTAFAFQRTAAALERVAGLAVRIDDVAVDDPSETVRDHAEATRLYLEDATTAVVDHSPTDVAIALRENRPDEFGDDSALGRLLTDCAACGDRIADVALEASLARSE